ncbi:uncharacterized protein [Henckelia pumila]|uniref:uncharacterized protein n=1 Tax=Henckelia pumila TaxID=405737 RepID=UPI003C6E3B43
MAQRSKSCLDHTPNYGLSGRPDCLTIKLYYNGEMKSGLHYKEYIGGQFEYFDYVDRDILGMIELWGYAEDVGCKDKQSIKFWHKFGETLKDERYLENDIDVMGIIPHIPSNYEVEIYIEQNDGASSQTGLGSILIRMETCVRESEMYNNVDEDVNEFDESDYDFDEDDRLFENFVDHDAGASKEKILTGIPCKHAVCALWCKHEDAEAFVSHYYTTEAYKKCYWRSIMPMNGPDLWPDCEFLPPLPPIYNKNKAGRPAKLRRREPDEPPAKSHTKLKASRRQNKCKSCGQLGHNQRTCTNDRNTQQEATSQQSNAQPTYRDSVLNPKEKLQVKRPSTIGIQIGGISNTLSNVNVDQSTIIQKPVFVKDGRNYTTVSRLRSISIDPRTHVQSASQPVSKPICGPNISNKKRIVSSQISVSKK